MASWTCASPDETFCINVYNTYPVPPAFYPSLPPSDLRMQLAQAHAQNGVPPMNSYQLTHALRKFSPPTTHSPIYSSFPIGTPKWKWTRRDLFTGAPFPEPLVVPGLYILPAPVPVCPERRRRTSSWSSTLERCHAASSLSGRSWILDASMKSSTRTSLNNWTEQILTYSLCSPHHFTVLPRSPGRWPIRSLFPFPLSFFAAARPTELDEHPKQLPSRHWTQTTGY